MRRKTAAMLLLIGCQADPLSPRPDAPTPEGDEPEPEIGQCDDAPILDRMGLDAQWADQIMPLLTRDPLDGGCAACHAPGTSHEVVIWADDPARTLDALWAGGLLTADGQPGGFVDVLSPTADLRMPLGGAVWPTAERQAVADFTCVLQQSGLEPPEPCIDDTDPGHTPLRRLSRFEYDHTVFALTGETTPSGDRLPADDPAFGFDTVAVAQQFSVEHLRRYQAVAESIAQNTLEDPQPLLVQLEAETLAGFLHSGAPITNPAHGRPIDGHFHFQRINAYVTTGLISFVYPGTYTLTVRVRAWMGDERAKRDDVWEIVDSPVAPMIRISLGGTEVTTRVVEGVYEGWGEWVEISVPVEIDAYPQDIRVGIANAFWGAYRQRDVELDLDWIEVFGPEVDDLPVPDAARLDRFLVCDGARDGCAEMTVEHALTTLWRRPAEAAEIARYQDLLNSEPRFDDGVRLVLEAAMLSPYFVYRPETHPALSGHELANRLAYFLWSGPPDEALLARAADGSLAETETLLAEVDRMLDDPRSRSLADNFAAQWLQLRQMETMTFSADALPEFDEPLRAAMIDEVRDLFDEMLLTDRSLLGVLDTDFTYVNDRLAAHYGMPLPGQGAEMVRVPTDGMPRGGLLTSAGFLALTSHPAKTSPTRRGKWILDQLLCQPPADPPENVETSVEQDGDAPSSLREALAHHATDPACASCHATMDPLGLSLEHFGPLGRWRVDDDFGMAVDPNVTLPTGEAIDGHEALADWLVGNPAFSACLTDKMAIYALGRDPRTLDQCEMARIEDDFADAGYTLRGLVKALVVSPLFRSRRDEAPGEYDEWIGGE